MPAAPHTALAQGPRRACAAGLVLAAALALSACDPRPGQHPPKPTAPPVPSPLATPAPPPA